MRRWNGWGDDQNQMPVSGAMAQAGREFLGPLTPPVDASWDDTLASVPDSRLPDHPMLDRGAEARVRHGVGQSFPDWVEIRSNRVSQWPDAVATPSSTEEVETLLTRARDWGAVVVPYGGGTSVVGHLRVTGTDRPVLLCSLERMAGIEQLDELGQLATFGAGAAGPVIEKALGERGLTLGHYPQSWELSTLGGWIATRSSGQLSRRYGRIEDMFAGGELVTPRGRLEMLPLPASAAGPNLRQFVLGSEGRLGIITRAQVRVMRTPEVETFRGAVLADEQNAIAAVRAIAQAGIALNTMRLSLSTETQINLAAVADGMLGKLVEGYPRLRRVGEQRCMLIYGASGSSSQVRQALAEARAVLGDHGAVQLGKPAGDHWNKSRFTTPYLRNGLWAQGVAVDTLETAVPWRKVPETVAALDQALAHALDDLGEKVVPFTHLSHTYPHGTSLYTSYLFRLAADPDETLARWQRLKRAASDVVVAQGGTISHQHGVGHDHKPWLEAETGALGLDLLRSTFATGDPDGLMHNGNLVD